MPRTCTICNHQDRKIIDGMIANRDPYLQIATKFGLNQRTVNTHGKNHVHPMIESIELQANAAVLKRVLTYRDEVNLPLPEKSKHLENHLRDVMAMCDKPLEIVAVAKAIREQQAEQAKLTGAYQSDRPNHEIIQKAMQSYVAWMEDTPDADERTRQRMLARFAKGAGVPETQFVKQYEKFEVSKEAQ